MSSRELVEIKPKKRSAVQLDLEQAQLHLEHCGFEIDDRVILNLYPPEDGPCIQIPKPGKDPDATLEELPALLKVAEKTLRHHLQHSLGVYINAGGTKVADIQWCRAIVAESDAVGLTEQEQIQAWKVAQLPEPSLTVRTGGKSLHFYWVLTVPCTPAKYTELTKRLRLALTGSVPDGEWDKGLHKPNQVMRLSGGVHPKTGRRTEIIDGTGERHSLDEIEACLPLLPETKVSGDYSHDTSNAPYERRRPAEQISICIDALKHVPPRGEPGSGTYNQALETLAALRMEWGAPTAEHIVDEAGWAGEHWDASAKIQSLDNPRKTIWSMFDAAVEGGWEQPWPRDRTFEQHQQLQQRIEDSLQAQAEGQPVVAYQSKFETAPFRVVGHTAKLVMFWSEQTGLVQELSHVQVQDPKHLRTLSATWWDSEECPFSFTDNESGKVVVDFNAAGKEILAGLQFGAIYDPQRIRGRGCWVDDGDVITHLGNELLVGTERTSIASYQTLNIYPRAKVLAGPAAEEISADEIQVVLDALKRFNFEDRASRFWLIGWIVSAPICGALPWRPSAWLTGDSGAGKTTLQEEVVVPLLGGTAQRASVGTTEAGLRQLLQHDSLPVVLDEVEQESDSARGDIQRILRLIRGSSSPGGAPVVKGSSSGDAVTYLIRSSFLLSSIVVGITSEADANRTVVLELEKLTQQQLDGYDETEELLAQIDEELGRRLIARTTRLLPVILKNCRMFKRVLSHLKGTARAGDVYGVLAACAASMRVGVGDREMTRDDCLKLLRQVGVEAVKSDEGEVVDSVSDHERCLQQLLLETSFQLSKASADRSVTLKVTAERALRIYATNELFFDMDEVKEALLAAGIKLVDAKGDRGIRVAVHPNSPVLMRLYSGTPWAGGGWDKVLKRHPLATRAQQRFASGQFSKQMMSANFNLTDLVSVD